MGDDVKKLGIQETVNALFTELEKVLQSHGFRSQHRPWWSWADETEKLMVISISAYLESPSPRKTELGGVRGDATERDGSAQ